MGQRFRYWLRDHRLDQGAQRNWFTRTFLFDPGMCLESCIFQHLQTVSQSTMLQFSMADQVLLEADRATFGTLKLRCVEFSIDSEKIKDIIGLMSGLHRRCQ
jgi:hypothetical protein